MDLVELFKHECKHEKFSADRDMGYCPDCGQLLENQWFIMRCACCGVKHKAIVRNGKIVPLNKFCQNCGSKEFEVEKVDKINFIDINYAVLIKQVITKHIDEFTQTWVDVTEKQNCKQRLLQQTR